MQSVIQMQPLVVPQVLLVPKLLELHLQHLQRLQHNHDFRCAAVLREHCSFLLCSSSSRSLQFLWQQVIAIVGDMGQVVQSSFAFVWEAIPFMCDCVLCCKCSAHSLS